MIAWRQSQLQSVNQITESSKNVGDLLNAKGITWGWFQGGFVPTGVDIQGRAVCGQHHAGLAGDDAIVNAGDYIAPRTVHVLLANHKHAPHTAK